MDEIAADCVFTNGRILTLDRARPTAGALAVQGGRVVAVVEPHRYPRVRALFQEFATSFRDADTVIVAPLDTAGEVPIEGNDHAALPRALRAGGHRSVALAARVEDIAPTVRRLVAPGDMVVCLGAGNSTEWAHALPQWLAADEPLRMGGAL